jgi:hypothetical protein
MAHVEQKVETRKSVIHARVWRVKTGRWEDLGVISRGHRSLRDTITNLLLRIRNLLRR